MSPAETSPVDFPTHEYPTLIRERHLDAFGHVNNAQYLVLFEEARWEMVTSRGYGFPEVLANGVGTVVLESNVRYKRELRLREPISIRTRVQEMRKKTIVVAQSILNSRDELAAEAVFTIGCFDLKQRKLIAFSPDWLRAVSGLRTPV
ncbi:MAG: acyl-CoA thioesterase [Bdellovibrionales bacterium]|nr:acyl-CoA thioesterase [Bdellovibrionales bacterium]